MQLSLIITELKPLWGGVAGFPAEKATLRGASSLHVSDLLDLGGLGYLFLFSVLFSFNGFCSFCFTLFRPIGF